MIMTHSIILGLFYFIKSELVSIQIDKIILKCREFSLKYFFLNLLSILWKTFIKIMNILDIQSDLNLRNYFEKRSSIRNFNWIALS